MSAWQRNDAVARLLQNSFRQMSDKGEKKQRKFFPIVRLFADTDNEFEMQRFAQHQQQLCSISAVTMAGRSV